VVIGAEVAQTLGAPLDLIIVRKIGHPLSPEYAIGAVTEDGDVVSNPQETMQLDPDWLASAAQEQMAEARRRRSLYLKDLEPIDVQDKVAILVDDGIATGFTVEAAIHQLRKRRPEKIVVAVPVAAAETADRIRHEVDDLVVITIPRGWFGAIGSYYRHFEQVNDEEVIALMESSRGLRRSIP
jgi:predicted phosphoribosyltransferase